MLKRRPGPAALALAPLVQAVLGEDPPIEVRFWDGSRLGKPDGPATIVLRSPDAVRRILYSPNEVGFGRAFIMGDADIEGDALAAIRQIAQSGPDRLRLGARDLVHALPGSARLGILGRPLPRPAEEARLHGGRHSRERDAAAIAHHYDVGNDFYQLVLGESMTYSCARFSTPSDSLETAQEAKYDLICRKLGLRPGMRLLDVGCGWGGMVIHAAAKYQVTAVGVTVSQPQFEFARKRVADKGLSGSVEIRRQDYRDVGIGAKTLLCGPDGRRDPQFDAISSIGMFEHVGKAQMRTYFQVLSAVLAPGGRLLNHAISTPYGARFDRHSFTARYVFPDGELQDVAAVAAAIEGVDLEVRDVESLREHYALTLQHWVANLEANWSEAVALVGPVRARIWKLYMLGAIVSFEVGDIAIHQVLAVKPFEGGASGMPLTRAAMI